jgi:hypothetical protein
MNDQATEHIAAPVVKTVTMWAAIAAGIGVQTWADAASFATFCAAAVGTLYSLILMTEWFWKKVWRPLAVHFGWLKPITKIWTPGDVE